MITSETVRPTVPPFDRDGAVKKVRLAEDAWNSRDPEKVAGACTVDSVWRNRSEFFSGREAIIQFLKRKWAKELDYRLIKELWVFRENRIAVRFAYEWHDDSGNWFRSYGNENWEFDSNGYMARRLASINDLPIGEADRKTMGLSVRRNSPGQTSLCRTIQVGKPRFYPGKNRFCNRCPPGKRRFLTEKPRFEGQKARFFRSLAARPSPR